MLYFTIICKLFLETKEIKIFLRVTFRWLVFDSVSNGKRENLSNLRKWGRSNICLWGYAARKLRLGTLAQPYPQLYQISVDSSSVYRLLRQGPVFQFRQSPPRLHHPVHPLSQLQQNLGFRVAPKPAFSASILPELQDH